MPLVRIGAATATPTRSARWARPYTTLIDALAIPADVLFQVPAAIAWSMTPLPRRRRGPVRRQPPGDRAMSDAALPPALNREKENHERNS
jgi:hypothetical protein